MAHYALLDENNVVLNVIVGKNEDELRDNEVVDWEEWYGNFHNLTCKRTSYNTYAGVHKLGDTPFRGNYAAVGMIYDEINDGFIYPQPFDSWTLNTTTFLWQPPIPKPELTDEQIENENYYDWDEDLYQSDNTLGWVLITE